MTTDTRIIDRVFLDSSILFSTCQAEDGLNRLWKLAENGRCQLLTSRYVIEKAVRNLRHPYDLKPLEKCLPSVQIVLESDTRLRCPIELPERARAVLMAAISAKSDYFLTGDAEYYGRYLGETIMGTKILSPRLYLSEKQLANGAPNVKPFSH